MSKRLLLLVVVVSGVAVSAAGAGTRVAADSREFDPGRTFLVQAEWLRGIGCPTNARSANPNAAFTKWNGTYTPYTDPACPTGDRSDRRNEGLVLAKTGPMENFASAVVDIRGVKGKTLTQLGYDIRKPGTTSADARGSWCGAGAPRFNIQTKDDFYFLGCASPPPTTQLDGHGFMRLTWGSPSWRSAPRVPSSRSPGRSSPSRSCSTRGRPSEVPNSDSGWWSWTTSTSTASASARTTTTMTTTTSDRDR